MLRSVIIDDEPQNVKLLRTMLSEHCPQVNNLAEASGVESGIEVIQQTKPDLVFLDIEMPQGSAFNILDKLYPVSFEIIFVTAFNSYALKAIKYSALDYLLKPVNVEELKQAVNKAADKISTKTINLQLKNMLDNVKNVGTGFMKIAIPSIQGLEFINVEDIIHCEAKRAYTYLYISKSKKLLSVKTLSEYEELLPSNIFFRVHHSHLINLKRVVKFHKGRGGQVEMENGALIEVATRRKDEFLAKFNI